MAEVRGSETVNEKPIAKYSIWRRLFGKGYFVVKIVGRVVVVKPLVLLNFAWASSLDGTRGVALPTASWHTAKIVDSGR